MISKWFICTFQIVLCGGGTKIPKLRDAIQNKLSNADMLSSINGDEVIAIGAARQVIIYLQSFQKSNNESIIFSIFSAILKINILKYSYQRYVCK